jgi:hypothetical protein
VDHSAKKGRRALVPFLRGEDNDCSRMKKIFNLRFVPFGTSFRRSDGAMRLANNDPDAAVLCDNEIVVDMGGRCFGFKNSELSQPEESLIFDHHFAGSDYPSASAAVLHHITDIVGILGPRDPVWIVTHAEPDFDALCSTYLIKCLFDAPTPAGAVERHCDVINPAMLLAQGISPITRRDDGQTLTNIDWFNPKVNPSAPAGWAVLLAAYASCVDNGKRLYAERSRRLHSVLYAAMLRGRPVREDGMESMFFEARRAIASHGRNPIFDPLFDENSRFAPELELLKHELRAYEHDLARARKSVVSLQVGRDFENWYPALQRIPLLTGEGETNSAHRGGPQSQQFRQADGIYLRDPECLLFKEWAREDLENSPLGGGFLFTAVAYTQGSTGGSLAGERYFFALDPEKSRDAHLYNVWAALQTAEVKAIRKMAHSSPSNVSARRGFEGRADAFGPFFADPWFDGANYRATLVVSPYRGSAMLSGESADLSDDPVVQVVVRELELSAYLGEVQLKDFSTRSREWCLAGDTGEPLVLRKTVPVEDAVMLGLGFENYRFGQVALDDRLNLANRQFAEQIGRQLWPFLELAGVRTCPSDFVERHLLVTPFRVLIWSRRGMIIAYRSAGKLEADFLGRQLGEIAGVARDIRAFQDEVRALLDEDRGADADAVQAKSYLLLDRVINSLLAMAMPEGGALRRFCEVTRIDGVLAMLRDLSATVTQYAETKRDKARNRLLAIMGAMFSLLSALNATTALMKFRLEDAEQGIWTWSNPSHRMTEYVVVSFLLLVSLAVLVMLTVAIVLPVRVRSWRKRDSGTKIARKWAP